MTIISEDQDHTVSITHDVERLEVQPHVTIAPTDSGPAILSQHIRAVILNSGTLQAYDGVILDGGDGDRFVNKSHGVIDAVENGVVMSNAIRVQVTNHGEITGEYGFVADNVRAAFLNNDGTILGDSSAIRVTGPGDHSPTAELYVYNDGLIEGVDEFGIAMGDPSVALRLTNSGTLHGGAGAIHGQMDYARIINTGEINGSLYLGEALRTSIITTEGLIDGDVHLSQTADDEFDASRDLDAAVTGIVYGGGGDDTLTGGYGADRFYGGAGADVLQALPGADFYIYGAARDSTAATHDSINTWDANDRLDLSAVDADKAVAGRQRAIFGGEINPGDAAPHGQVVYYHQGGDTYVVLDHNGSNTDSNLLIDIHGTVTLTADNFIL